MFWAWNPITVALVNILITHDFWHVSVNCSLIVSVLYPQSPVDHLFMYSYWTKLWTISESLHLLFCCIHSDISIVVAVVVQIFVHTKCIVIITDKMSNRISFQIKYKKILPKRSSSVVSTYNILFYSRLLNHVSLGTCLSIYQNHNIFWDIFRDIFCFVVISIPNMGESLYCLHPVLSSSAFLLWQFITVRNGKCFTMILATNITRHRCNASIYISISKEHKLCYMSIIRAYY